MENPTLQERVLNLKSLFQDQKFDDAESILTDLLIEFPDYQTPLILYIQLFETIEHDNPLYDKILQLSGHFSLWEQFPPNLVPSWYTKIQTRNLKIKTEEESKTEHSAETTPVLEDVTVDESEIQSIDEILVSPEPVSEVEEVIHIVQPEEIIPDDLELLIEDQPGQTTDFAQDGYTELDDLLPDLHEPTPEIEEVVKPYNTSHMFDETEEGLTDDLNAVENSNSDNDFSQFDSRNDGDETKNSDDEIMVASETMAEIFVQQQKYSQALKVYRILMEEDPDNFDYYFRRIQELETMGK